MIIIISPNKNSEKSLPFLEKMLQSKNIKYQVYPDRLKASILYKFSLPIIYLDGFGYWHQKDNQWFRFQTLESLSFALI